MAPNDRRCRDLVGSAGAGRRCRPKSRMTLSGCLSGCEGAAPKVPMNCREGLGPSAAPARPQLMLCSAHVTSRPPLTDPPGTCTLPLSLPAHPATPRPPHPPRLAPSPSPPPTAPRCTARSMARAPPPSSSPTAATRARKAGPLMAQRAADAGYLALTYDYRAWRGAGQFDLALLNQADADLRAAADFARAQGAQAIALVGGSLGGIASAKDTAAIQPAALIIIGSPLSNPALTIRSRRPSFRTTCPSCSSPRPTTASCRRPTRGRCTTPPPSPRPDFEYPGSAHATDLFLGPSGRRLWHRNCSISSWRTRPARLKAHASQYNSSAIPWEKSPFMTTPFDNRLLLVHWIAKPLRPTRDIFGNIDPRANELGFSARDFCQWARAHLPTPERHFGQDRCTAWSGRAPAAATIPQDVRAITSLDRLRDWLRACNEVDLELHTWCVPVGRVERRQHRQAGSRPADPDDDHPGGRRGRQIAVARRGEPARASGPAMRQDVPQLLGPAARRPARYARRGHPRLSFPHAGARGLYHRLGQRRPTACTRWCTRANFSPAAKDMPIEREMRRAFAELKLFNKPIVPMLQPHDASSPVKRLTRPEEITAQADWAMQLGAPGLTYFRTGTDHFQSSQVAGLRRHRRCPARAARAAAHARQRLGGHLARRPRLHRNPLSRKPGRRPGAVHRLTCMASRRATRARCRSRAPRWNTARPCRRAALTGWKCSSPPSWPTPWWSIG